MRNINRLLAGFIIATAAITVTGCGDSVELKLQRAKIALSTDKPDNALALADAVLKEQPDNLEAIRYKATALMRLDKLDESRAIIDALLVKKPNEPEAHTLLTDWTFRKLGELMRQSAFASSAELQANFDKTLELGRTEADWLENTGKKIAEARFLRGRYAEGDSVRLMAISRVKRADLTNINPDTREPTEVAGEVIRQLDAQAEAAARMAADQMRSALEANPRYFEAVEAYTRLLMRLEDWQMFWALANKVSTEAELPVSAFDRLTMGLMRMPDAVQPAADRLALGRKLQAQVSKNGQESSLWKVTAARLHLMAREFPQAKAALEDVLKTSRNDIDARYLMAQSLYGLNEFTEAKKILDKLSVEQPRSSRIQSLYGLTLLKLNEPEMAKEALRKATDLDSTDPIPREALITAMSSEGNMKEASEDVETFYNNNPGDPRAIRVKMGYELARGNIEGVRDLMSRVEKVAPRTPELMDTLTDGYLALRDYVKAERFAAELTRARPDSLDAHLRLAQTQLMQGRDEEVTKNLTALKDKFPKSGGVNQMLGKLYLQRGGYDRAVALLEESVKTDPANHEARLLLSRGYAALSMPDEALEQIQTVLDRTPQNAEANALAARVYQMTGQNEKANEHLQQIDPSQIDESTNPTLLVQLKLRQGELDDAISIANRAVASGNPDPSLRLLLADAYSKKKDSPQVEANLIALVRAQPTSARAFEMLSRFYVDQGAIDRGLGSLATLQATNEVLARLSQAALLSATGKRPEALQRLEPVYAPLIRDRSREALSIADAMGSIYVTMNQPAKAYAVYEALNDAKLFPVDVAMRQIQLTSAVDKPEQVAAKLENVITKLTPEQNRFRRPILQRFVAIGKVDRAMELVDAWQKASPSDVNLLILKGELLSQAGRQKDAIAVYAEATQLQPENVSLRQLLSRSHMLSLDFAGAEKALIDMEKIDEGARILSLAMRGQMFLDLGLTHQASATFELLERTGKQRDPRVLFAIGQAYSSLNKDDLAMQRLSEVPPFAPQYPGAQILLARIEQRRGKADAAKARLEVLIRNPAYSAIATRELLSLSANNQQDEELLRWSDQALSVEKLPVATRASWLNTRVTLCANRKDWPSVIRALEQLAEIQPDSVNIPAARTVVLLYTRKTDEALRVFKSQPKLLNATGGYLLAQLLNEKVEPRDLPLSDFILAMAKGNPDAARSAASRVNNRANVFRDDLLAITNRPDAASPEMSAAFRDLALALIAAESGLPQLTGDIAQNVVNRFPAVIPAHGLLAQSLIERNLPADTALLNLRKAAPDSSAALLLSATEKVRIKDYNGALEDYQSLLKREPDNDNILYYLTQTQQRTGKYDDAIVILKKLYAGKGNYRIAAANDLSYLMAVRQPDKLDEARTIAQETIKLAPGFTPLIDTVGWIEHLAGNDAKALPLLNQAVTGLRSVPEVHYHLAVVYHKLGNTAWSQYHLKEALAATDKDTPWYPDAKKLGGN